MPVFIVKISEKDLSTLKSEGTEYFDESSSEEVIAAALANYSSAEDNYIEPGNIAVMRLS